MAKTEFRLTSLPTEPDASERPTRPVLEMKSVLEKSHAAEPRHEQGAQEFSPQNLKAFENRASVVSRVLARSLDSHRAGASSNEVGKELRSAQRKMLHGDEIVVTRPMAQIARALEAASKLTTGGMEDADALHKLYISLDHMADLSPDAFGKFSKLFDAKMSTVVANMKQRKQAIAEKAKQPSSDLETLMQETDAMETELLEINQDLPVAAKFQKELSTFRDEVRRLRDATLQEFQRRQLKEAA